jgi:hypothetical protein
METTQQTTARVEALAEWLHNRDNARTSHRWEFATDHERNVYRFNARNALRYVDTAEPAWPAGKEGRWPR